MGKFKLFLLILALGGLCSCTPKPEDGEYVLHLFTTNDVHGHYFDSTYVSDGINTSLLSAYAYVKQAREELGEENVIFVDAGDCLQGDNASYYYNYVDTGSKHVYARMAEYMGYDAVVVGNHDIETGHPVYDRVRRTMKVPFLAANCIEEATGKPYFQPYVLLNRHGLKIAIIGFTNPNIHNWLSPKLWEGLEFKELVPFVQETVNQVTEDENPDVVIVAMHSGTGDENGNNENHGLMLLNSLEGVDFLVCAHDHRPVVYEKEGICLINSGSHCHNLGHGTVYLRVENGELVEKSVSADLLVLDKSVIDEEMQAEFYDDYEAVKEFTVKEIGELTSDLRGREAFVGMSDYINLLHTLALENTSAELSMAAPLSFNAFVKAGTLLYNDLFTIYPFENQLFVVNMKGQEILDYLEMSYDGWINTIDASSAHLLKISNEQDERSGQRCWSFVNRSYNFDSCGGLVYSVDCTRPKGKRVIVEGLADGREFDLNATYKVGMTSYRASGGGGLMRDGAGIDTDKIDERVVEYCPEIRAMLYDYICKVKVLDPADFGKAEVVGHWEFAPSSLTKPLLEKDFDLLYPVCK